MEKELAEGIANAINLRTEVYAAPERKVVNEDGFRVRVYDNGYCTTFIEDRDWSLHILLSTAQAIEEIHGG